MSETIVLNDPDFDAVPPKDAVSPKQDSSAEITISLNNWQLYALGVTIGGLAGALIVYLSMR
ncbi:MAG: hypothetical protein V1821_00190 [bacterium]